MSGLTRAVQDSPELAAVAETTRLHVLLGRIQDGPDETQERCDDSLKQSLAISLPIVPSLADVKAVAAAIGFNSWGEGSQSLRVCDIVQAISRSGA